MILADGVLRSEMSHCVGFLILFILLIHLKHSWISSGCTK